MGWYGQLRSGEKRKGNTGNGNGNGNGNERDKKKTSDTLKRSSRYRMVEANTPQGGLITVQRVCELNVSSRQLSALYELSSHRFYDENAMCV